MAKTTYTASNLDKYTIAQLEVAAKKYDDMIKEADENGDLAKKQIFAARQARIIKQQYAIKRMHAKLSQKFPSIKNANVRTISILTMKRTEGKEIVQGGKNKTGYGFGGLMNDLKGVGLGVSTGLIAYGTANSILVATTGQGVFDNIGSLITKLADIGGVGFNIAGASTILAGAGAIAAIGISCLVAKKVRQIQANRIAAMRASLQEDEALAEAEKDASLADELEGGENAYNDKLISDDTLRKAKVQEIASDPNKRKELEGYLNLKDITPEQRSAISTILTLAQVEAAKIAESRVSKQIFAGLQAMPEAEAFLKAQKAKTQLATDQADLAAAVHVINTKTTLRDNAKSTFDASFNKYASAGGGTPSAAQIAQTNADLDDLRKKRTDRSVCTKEEQRRQADAAIAEIDRLIEAGLRATPISMPTDTVLKNAVAGLGIASGSKAEAVAHSYIAVAIKGDATNGYLFELEAQKKTHEQLATEVSNAQSTRDNIIKKYHPDYATLKANAALVSTAPGSDHAKAKSAMDTQMARLGGWTGRTPPPPPAKITAGETVYKSTTEQAKLDNINILQNNASLSGYESTVNLISSTATLNAIPAPIDANKLYQVCATDLSVSVSDISSKPKFISLKDLCDNIASNVNLILADNAKKAFDAKNAPIAALDEAENGDLINHMLTNANADATNAYNEMITTACGRIDATFTDPAKAQAMKNKIQAMTPAQLEAFLQKGLDLGAAELGA